MPQLIFSTSLYISKLHFSSQYMVLEVMNVEEEACGVKLLSDTAYFQNK